jgi:hypothetical protein
MYEDSDAAPTRSQGSATAQQPQQYQQYPQQQYPQQQYAQQHQQYPQQQQFQQQQPYPPYGHGYQRPFGGLRQQHWPTETKPFLLTSEFALVVLTVIGLAITASTSATVDARYFWAATVALVVGYVLSRGIAKSGSKSHANDPRDQIDYGRFGGGNDDH